MLLQFGQHQLLRLLAEVLAQHVEGQPLAGARVVVQTVAVVGAVGTAGIADAVNHQGHHGFVHPGDLNDVLGVVGLEGEDHAVRAFIAHLLAVGHGVPGVVGQLTVDKVQKDLQLPVQVLLNLHHGLGVGQGDGGLLVLVVHQHGAVLGQDVVLHLLQGHIGRARGDLGLDRLRGAVGGALVGQVHAGLGALGGVAALRAAAAGVVAGGQGEEQAQAQRQCEQSFHSKSSFFGK